jgi:hypothetical protein
MGPLPGDRTPMAGELLRRLIAFVGVLFFAALVVFAVVGCARVERCQRPDVVAGEEGTWIVQSWCVR